jgi:hypothetical protein
MGGVAAGNIQHVHVQVRNPAGLTINPLAHLYDSLHPVEPGQQATERPDFGPMLNSRRSAEVRSRRLNVPRRRCRRGSVRHWTSRRQRPRDAESWHNRQPMRRDGCISTRSHCRDHSDRGQRPTPVLPEPIFPDREVAVSRLHPPPTFPLGVDWPTMRAASTVMERGQLLNKASADDLNHGNSRLRLHRKCPPCRHQGRRQAI